MFVSGVVNRKGKKNIYIFGFFLLVFFFITYKSTETSILPAFGF